MPARESASPSGRTSQGVPVKPWISRQAPRSPGSSKGAVFSWSSLTSVGTAPPLATRAAGAVCRRSMADPKLPETALHLHIDDAVAAGVCVIEALVNHTESEFTVD